MNHKNNTEKKRGRPKLSEQVIKDERLEIRLNRTTADKLMTYCAKHDLSMSQAARNGFAKLFDEAD